jgi:hypothetical protein
MTPLLSVAVQASYILLVFLSYLSVLGLFLLYFSSINTSVPPNQAAIWEEGTNLQSYLNGE